jgi:hypothetical protein
MKEIYLLDYITTHKLNHHVNRPVMHYIHPDSKSNLACEEEDTVERECNEQVEKKLNCDCSISSFSQSLSFS